MITAFHLAESLEEALEYRRKGYDYLAGGTQVNNGAFHEWTKKSTKHWDGDSVKVVSLESLDLQGISREGKQVHIGSLTRLQDIADSEDLSPALRKAAGFIPTRNIRNLATIGGNIGANRRDSYIIPTLMAYGARLECLDEQGAKVLVSCEDYVSQEMKHLILKVRIPDITIPCVTVKESRSQLALAVVSASVGLVVEKGILKEARVAAGCVSKHVIRLTALERALEMGREGYEEVLSTSISPNGDILGSTEYKRYINSVVIADAVRACKEEAAL
jgi:putative selenate reductase FAD-binding subunit